LLSDGSFLIFSAISAYVPQFTLIYERVSFLLLSLFPEWSSWLGMISQDDGVYFRQDSTEKSLD
jgi:hypothetical protein